MIPVTNSVRVLPYDQLPVIIWRQDPLWILITFSFFQQRLARVWRVTPKQAIKVLIYLLSKFIHDNIIWCSHDIVNLGNLIYFIGTGKKRMQTRGGGGRGEINQFR